MKTDTKSERKTKAAKGKPLADPKEAGRKVRAWLLRTHPGEKALIGNFSKDVTFAEVNRRMHKGEDFYAICNCGESVQREYVFAEMARVYGTDYDYWYNLWLHGGKKSGVEQKVIKALKKSGLFEVLSK